MGDASPTVARARTSSTLRRDLVRAVLLGKRAEEAAGAPRLAHDARPGDERADALVAVHATVVLELVERAAHGDQAHAGHGGELGCGWAAGRPGASRSSAMSRSIMP